MAEIKYIIPFTYKWEGGLSRDPADKASVTPSPYEYKGQKGWHTNKGVTYAAFKSNAAKLGYQDTAQNFLTMPEDIWLKIAKGSYWDRLNLDSLKSQAVANIMFSWQWGSGYAWIRRVSEYLKSKGINWTGGTYKDKKLIIAPDFKTISDKLNELIDKQGEQKTFDELAEQKKQFLISLNQPKYTKGWLNRLDDLKKYSYTLLGSITSQVSNAATNATEVVKKNPLKTALIAAGVTIIIYTGYKLIKKNI